MISEEVRLRFVKAGYRIVGGHSAVDVCHYTKESLRKGTVCYKERWYGIESHRCLEMTPALVCCTHMCRFCWRPLEYTTCEEAGRDDPERIIEGCIAARRALLSGFKGNEQVDKRKWEESIRPTSAAISLAGEPTLYPRLSELIEAFRKREMATFLVTNGTRPDRLRTLNTEPTNLYISLCAPDEVTYRRIHRPLIANGWEKVKASLQLLRNMSCRTVVRITLVKGMNMEGVAKYADLIGKAEPDFVEPKGFMHVGEARERLPRAAMPIDHEVREFANALAEKLSYEVVDYVPQSRVALLKK